MNKIPFLNMAAQVQIAGPLHKTLFFENVSSIEITESIKELSSSAKIVLPRFYQELESKPVLDYIKAGDQVIIKFGYLETHTQNNIEFEGFIKEIGSETPLEITCDQLYPLRQKGLSQSYKAISLKEVLEFITKGTFISKIECPNVQLGKYEIKNKTPYQELQKIKEQFAFFSRVNGTTLQVGFAYDWIADKTGTHVYHMQSNVRKSDLTFKKAEASNVQLRVNIKNGKGKDAYRPYESKENNDAIKTHEYAAADTATAEKIIKSWNQQNLSDGYTGSITGFGFPVTKAGDSLTIHDSKDPAREGTYLIEKVVKTYSAAGISRKNDLAFKAA